MRPLIYDTETNGLDPTKIWMFVGTFADTDETVVWLHPEAEAVIPKASMTGCTILSDEAALRALLNDPNVQHVGHNIIGFDVPVLVRLAGINEPPPDRLYDTQSIGSLWKPDAKGDKMVLLKTGKLLPKDVSRSEHGMRALRVWGIRLGERKVEYTGGFDAPSLDMFTYCLQDVKTCLKLYRTLQAAKLSPESVALENEFTVWMERQKVNGFTYNRRDAAILEAKLRSELEEVTAKCRETMPPKVTTWYVRRPGMWNKKTLLTRFGYSDTGSPVVKDSAEAKAVFGDTYETWISRTNQETADAFWERRESSEPFNPGSTQQLAGYFMSLGWEPEEYTDAGNVTMDEPVIELLVERFPEATLVGRYLMLTKRLGSLADGTTSWANCVQPDGKMHGSVLNIGTVTNRCAHMHPNMGQVTSVTKPYGKECRALFSARDGYQLVGADASGLQLRCLAHYLAPIDGGEYAKIVTTGDVHSANQKAAGLETRAQAKTFIYAWLFGGGDERIGDIVGGGAREGALLKARFLSGLPQLAELKKRLDRVLKERKWLCGLDGRIIPIRSKHAALNTLLMSAEAVLVKTATVDFCRNMSERHGPHGGIWGLCAHVHDEFQTEVLPTIADETAKLAVTCISRSGEPYGFLCPLAGEAKIGKTWYDTH